VYQGMVKFWNANGQKQQAAIQFLYGPSTAKDPLLKSWSERAKEAAVALKALVEEIQTQRKSLAAQSKCSEPIFIYAYSEGAAVVKMALEQGMTVDGVVI